MKNRMNQNLNKLLGASKFHAGVCVSESFSSLFSSSDSSSESIMLTGPNLDDTAFIYERVLLMLS
jgi:endo-1,4-beta-D-glucanase Y